jgi:hypothetical protein
MSSHEQRITELNKRVEAIDVKVGDLALSRHASALDAVGGSKDALRLIAQIDAQTEALLKERETVSAACEAVEALIAAEAAAADKAKQRELEVEAGKAASAIVAIHEEIDVHLNQLRQLFERRSSLVVDLGRCGGGINPAFIARLAGRSGPTAAAQFAGLGKYLDLVHVAAGSARPLSESNAPLIALSERAVEIAEAAS